MLRKDLIVKITPNLNFLSDNILSNLSRHIDYEVYVKKCSELKAKNWYSKRHDLDATKDLGKWYNKYNSWSVSWNPNTWKQFNGVLDKKQQKKEIQIKPENLIINLDGRLEFDELVKILYSGAEYGGDDLTNTNIKSFKTGDFIQTISDSTIDTKLDCNQIDLSGYLNANGEKRTINVINKINHTIEYRYNCDKIVKSIGKKITKAELLCAMYNIKSPYGIHWIQAIDKIKTDDEYKLLEPKDADKLLTDNNNYIDYLCQVPIKTSFASFPIIDYRAYSSDDYNTDYFERCIELLKNV